MGQSYFIEELYITPNFSRHPDFKHIILSIISTFTKTITEAILTTPSTNKTASINQEEIWPAEITQAETIVEWLPHCLRYVRSCYTTLIKIDLPSEALDIIGTYFNNNDPNLTEGGAAVA